MAVRSGSEFIEGLRRNPREVWAHGRRITNVADDPVFARPVRAIADLYDLQVSPEHRDAMTTQEGGETFGTSFLIPRSRRATLVKRRLAMKVWAEASFGLLGRSPDFLNTVLMAWAENADFFGQRGAAIRRQCSQLLPPLPRARLVRHPRHRQSADRPLAPLARAGRSVRPSRRGRGDQGGPDRARRQDARHPRPDRRRAPGLSRTRHPRGRRPLRPGIRHSLRHQGAAIHLPRAVRRRHAEGFRPSARRPLRGARRGVRVRRRADSLGPRVPLRRRQDGQRAVRARRASATTPATRPPCAGLPNASSWSASWSR